MPDRAAPSDEALARAHERLLQDHSLQFDRVSVKIPEPPEWLRWLGEALEKLAPVLKWAFWIALGLLVALILYFIARELMRLGRPRARADKPVVLTDGEWRPDAQAARMLSSEQEAASAPKQKINVDYEIGDSVKVLDGPFASFNGVVEELDFDRGRVKVSVSIFGRATPVELEFEQVERVK